MITIQLTPEELKTLLRDAVRDVLNEPKEAAQPKWIRADEVEGVYGITEERLEEIKKNEGIRCGYHGSWFSYEIEDLERLIKKYA